MFRIGDFAKMARVSVKSLHHYDDIDLLKPEVVHTTNGYRYYTIDQLPRLNRILALKDLGFTLNQIRSLLNENLSLPEIHGMLRLKEGELEKMIQEEQERLERVKVRLKQIEREEVRHDYDILVKSIEPQTIVSVRGTIPLNNDPFQQCQEMANEVYTWIQRAGGRISGHWRSIYHETVDESQNERIDIEMAAEVDDTFWTKGAHISSERVITRTLPGTSSTACLLLPGDYDGLWNAHIALMTWIETSGYTSVGPFSCIYLRLPIEGGKPFTELQIPIEIEQERENLDV